MGKYELTPESVTVQGQTLYRIRALRDFGSVRAGDLGGFIASEANLSQEGLCWVADGACVYQAAQVAGDARVSGSAQVSNSARVYGSAQVYGEAEVSASAQVYEGAQVYGSTWLYGDARVYGTARVFGSARVCGYAQVYGSAQVYGEAEVSWRAEVYGSAQVYEGARICGSARVCGDARVSHRHWLHLGEWRKSPPWFGGSRDPVCVVSPTMVDIGRLRLAVWVWWREYRTLLAGEGYTPAQIKEYGKFLNSL